MSLCCGRIHIYSAIGKRIAACGGDGECERDMTPEWRKRVEDRQLNEKVEQRIAEGLRHQVKP